MHSVTCRSFIVTPSVWTAAEAEHLSSSFSELHQLGWGSSSTTKGRFSKCAMDRQLKSRSQPLDGMGSLGVAWATSVHVILPKDRLNVKVLASTIADPLGRGMMSSEQKVYDVVAKQAAMVDDKIKRKRPLLLDVQPGMSVASSPELLNEAYERCGEVCAEYAKTFFLGTKLMTPERQRAIWAIYVWCRRTDELVDGPNASRISPAALDRWEERLEDTFRGQPYDMLDAALADTVSRYPVDMQPFRDMIDGMRMDLVKSRYNNFDELYLYCYNVAGTVGLMSVPVMGISPDSNASTQSVYSGALALGIANQLTNILRDVGEDARRGRIYLPQDELAKFELSDDDIFTGIVTDKWRAFMKDQIRRARMFFVEAERSVPELDKDSRWPVWSALILYQQILDAVEANDYNNFTKRAYVGKWKKFVLLPAAYGRALVAPSAPSRPIKAA